MLGVMAEINHFNCKKFLQTHLSITPSFHYSNWGEAPKFILSKFSLLHILHPLKHPMVVLIVFFSFSNHPRLNTISKKHTDTGPVLFE
jgi:hypothetical protein